MIANLYIHGTEPSVNQKQEWVGGFSADVPFRGCWAGGSVVGFRALRRGHCSSYWATNQGLSIDQAPSSPGTQFPYLQAERTAQGLWYWEGPLGIYEHESESWAISFWNDFKYLRLWCPTTHQVLTTLQELHRCFQMSPLILTPTLCVGVIIPV